ncbi:MAG: hypothetical protein AVDCRST_MAG12-225, partial [uncultured Rubrobacteraceae bacterium]
TWTCTSWSAQTPDESRSTCSRTTRPTCHCTRCGRRSCASTSQRRSSSGGRATSSSPQRAARRTCATCPKPNCTGSIPATSPSRTTSTRSPVTSSGSTRRWSRRR